MEIFRDTITQKGPRSYLLGSTKYKQSLLAKYSSLCRQESLKRHGVHVYPFGRLTKKWKIINLKNLKNFETIYQSGKKIIKCGDIEIDKTKISPT